MDLKPAACLTVFALAMTLGCTGRPAAPPVMPVELTATDGQKHALVPSGEGAPLTVLVFSAWHCPCQSAHDVRLGELFARYHSRGVEVYAVDSELGGNLADDAAQAQKRDYGFPVLLDSGAALARALRAEYATETFVLDRRGRVRYHGGLDSDGVKLHDDAVPHLENALDDLLSGKEPRTAETKSLGCALQTW